MADEREPQPDRRDAILEAVQFTAERLLSEAIGWDSSVQAVLRRLGEATGASRVYVFSNRLEADGEVWGTQRFEWVAAGVSTQMDNELMQAIPYRAAGFGRWVDLLNRGEPIHGHARDFPPAEQPELEAQGILSILIVPIFVESRWWGQIGFDACGQERDWSRGEVGALAAAAGTLGAALRRRMVSEELRQSEERYRAVVEQATDGIFLLDAETKRVVETNPAFQRMLGYTADELCELSIYDFVAHPRADVDAVIRQTLAKRRRLVGERRYRRKRGSLVDVDVSVSVIAHGGRDVICTIARDITQRKRDEAALRQSEERFRSAFESAAIGMALFSLDGSWLQVNRPLAELLGYSQDELRRRSYVEVTHPDDVELSREKVRQLSAGEISSYELEKRYLTRDGHVVWVSLAASLVRDADGKPLHGIEQIQDITESKRAREELRESERLYRAVMEQANENIMLVDVETLRIVEANPTFRRTLGLTDSELAALTLYDVVAADRATVEANVQRVIQQRQPNLFERQYLRKDGSPVDAEVTASTIVRHGRPTFCVVAHDVTERARVQGLLEQRVAVLSQLSADLRLDAATGQALDALCKEVVAASSAVACTLALTEDDAGPPALVSAPALADGFAPALASAYRDGDRPRYPFLEPPSTFERRLIRGARQLLLADPSCAPIRQYLRDVGWDTVFYVPLVSRGRVLGAAHYCYPSGGEPTEDERVFLGAIADQTAVAVENARLFATASEKAALEERQRLARELHDSVSQVLYGIALGTETARLRLDRNPARVAETLDYVRSLAKTGMAEMRALIFELRPESLKTEGLVAALDKQAVALEARHNVAVDAALCHEPDVALPVKEALFRIAQEALHNVVRHASASSVRIALTCEGGGLVLELTDDGVGFDTGRDFPGHLGLRSMRERLERLGGDLELSSAPGAGTRIRAALPAG